MAASSGSPQTASSTLFNSDDRLRGRWVLLAHDRMRRGEAVGLRWADVDLDGSRLRVLQTITPTGNVVRVGEPKTSRGRRSIALDAGTGTVLREHRRRMLEERLLVGADFDDDGLVFHQPDGNCLRPDAVSNAFLSRVGRYGLPRLTLHGLRHTWATLALECGTHPGVVQERLGQSTIAITLGIYSRVTPTRHDETAGLVASLVRDSAGQRCIIGLEAARRVCGADARRSGRVSSLERRQVVLERLGGGV